jgi:thioredoxin 2
LLHEVAAAAGVRRRLGEVTVIRECPSCGAQNRVPPRHLSDRGRCGACKAALPPVDAPINADPSLFDEVVRDAKVPILVDFWASWCGPCRAVAPQVEKAASDLKGRALVLKVDTQRFPGLAARYGVEGIPNFVVMKAGKLVFQQAGAVGADTLEGWLAEAGA